MNVNTIDFIASQTNYNMTTFEPIQFNLVVDIIDQCNYNCYYCYNNKKRSNRIINLNKLYDFIYFLSVKYSNLIISVGLLGGEPTLHPDIDSFIIKCNNIINVKCCLFSNFSADISKYIQYLKYNVKLNLSFHIFDNKLNQIFIDKLKYIPIKYFLTDVNIILLYDIYKLKETLNIFDQLFIKYPESVSMPLLIDNQNFVAEYTPNMYHIYDKLVYSNDIYKCMRHKYQLMIKSNNVSYYIMHEMYNDKRYSQYRNFYRYLCDAGKYSLYIHNTGNIYPCETYYYDINKPICSIYNFNNIKLRQTLCECDSCGCAENAKKIKIFNKNIK